MPMWEAEEVTKSHLEEQMWAQLQQASLATGCVRQHRFCPPRRWTWDFAWIDRALAVEIDGGGFVYGRHNRPGGQEKDYEKANTATLLGWRVLRFTGRMLNEDQAVPFIKQVLAT